MRTRLISAALTATLVLTACGGDGELTLEDARSRMSPRMVGVAAVFVDISNNTDTDDALLSAAVDPGVAARVELHETFDMDDAMSDGMDHDMDDAMGDDMDDAMDHDMDDAMDHGDPGPEGFAMMGMREVMRIELPAGETIRLEPGGLHIMLIGLDDDLVPGEEFDITLVFEQAGEQTITVEVREQV